MPSTLETATYRPSFEMALESKLNEDYLISWKERTSNFRLNMSFGLEEASL